MFNANDMGKNYMRVVQLKDTALMEDAVPAGEEAMAGNWVLADTDDVADGVTDSSGGDFVIVAVEYAKTATVIGSSMGARWYEGQTQLLVDSQGRRWIDAALHDEIFC